MRTFSRLFPTCLVIAVLSFVSLPGNAGADTLQDAKKAYEYGNYETTMLLLKPLAEDGNPEAQVLIGAMYNEGRGVPHDYVQAVKWYRKAAEQGEANAQYSLGVKYERGQGIPQDYAQAAKWYTKAAEQGLAEAQNNLGVMYYEGHGVPQDYVQAHMWINLAAVQGNAKYAEIRNMVAKHMTPEQIAEAQRLARDWKPKGVEKPGIK